MWISYRNPPPVTECGASIHCPTPDCSSARSKRWASVSCHHPSRAVTSSSQGSRPLLLDWQTGTNGCKGCFLDQCSGFFFVCSGATADGLEDAFLVAPWRLVVTRQDAEKHLHEFRRHHISLCISVITICCILGCPAYLAALSVCFWPEIAAVLAEYQQGRANTRRSGQCPSSVERRSARNRSRHEAARQWPTLCHLYLWVRSFQPDRIPEAAGCGSTACAGAFYGLCG